MIRTWRTYIRAWRVWIEFLCLTKIALWSNVGLYLCPNCRDMETYSTRGTVRACSSGWARMHARTSVPYSVMLRWRAWAKSCVSIQFLEEVVLFRRSFSLRQNGERVVESVERCSGWPVCLASLTCSWRVLFFFLANVCCTLHAAFCRTSDVMGVTVHHGRLCFVRAVILSFIFR